MVHSCFSAPIAVLALGLGIMAAHLDAAPFPKLSVGIMPAVDSAPLLLAEKRGYYAAAGVDVSLTIFTSAMERQVALQSGAVDGAITDLVAFAYNVQGGFDLRISSSTDGSFPFLVRKGFQEKNEIVVGMMEVSVTNFLSDAWLGGKYRLDKVFITEIPARLEMIRQGRLDMACLPEPIASMGQLSGLEKRVFPNGDGYLPDVMAFTAAAANTKLDAIRRFHAAVDRAVEDINADPGLARDVLVEGLRLDSRIRDIMLLPEFHTTRLPDSAYLGKISAWIAALQGKPVAVDWPKVLLRLSDK